MLGLPVAMVIPGGSARPRGGKVGYGCTAAGGAGCGGAESESCRDTSNQAGEEDGGGWRRDRTPPTPTPLQPRVLVLTLSEPDSEDTEEEEEEEEECCWGLGMDMGESALCGDAESLCCSSEPALGPTTAQGSCSGPLGGGTSKRGKKGS